MPVAFDTMGSAHLINEELPLSLRSQANLHLGITNWGKGSIKFGEDSIPPTPLLGEDGMGVYCARDTGYAHLLADIEKTILVRDQGLARLFKYLIVPGLEAYATIEQNGIWVDLDRCDAREAEMDKRNAELEIEIDSYISEECPETHDPKNDNFLRRWLFSYEGYEDKEHTKKKPNWWGLDLEPISYTEKTRLPQVDESVLEALDHPAAKLLVEQRHITKSKHFFAAWREWSDPFWRLHPFFNLTGTATGRRSCDRPNLQQVPRDKALRTCIGVPPGKVFLEVDYSQVEVRLAAWEAGELMMIKILSDPDGDIYRYTAAKLMGVTEDALREGLAKGEKWAKEGRQKAKAVVLGFLYGMGWKNFAVYAKETYGVDLTPDEAEKFRNTFFNLYPALEQWHKDQKAVAKFRLMVRSQIGRIRRLVRMLSNDWSTVSKAERQAINSPIQGLGGDLTLASVVTLTGMIDPNEVMIIGDVHDALLFEIREDVWKKWCRVILEVMEGIPLLQEKFGLHPPLRLKAEAKAGRYWSEPRTWKGDVFVQEFNLEELDEVELRLG